ncbi:MAG: dodecin family protein [Piscirickettsiaceae bacterium]|nr:dodecin family protein [Piscirickettsiaceae bacterium]
MTEHTYKHIELTGSSAESSDQAIKNAIAKASETIKNLHWFNVVDSRGYIEDGGVKYWQVTIKVGFRIEE